MHLGYWDDPEAPHGEFATAQRRLDERLLALAAAEPGFAVLDVGCGLGGTLEMLNGRLSDARLDGVNIDPRQLEVCAMLRAANGNRLAWHLADACALPFADASFDRVLCIEAMFHFGSRRAFFREAARVLRPGGALVASDIVLRPSARALALPGMCIEAPLQDGYAPWPDFWCEDADHEALARDAGLALAVRENATGQTRPSHRDTLPRNVDAARDPGDVATRAGLMLRWLHEAGHLDYWLYRLDKPAAGA